jgi:hypothetical protein
MEYLNYKTLVEETKNLSHKIIFVDGPRRCSTNYARKSLIFTLDDEYIAVNMAHESHDHSIYKKDVDFLHNKNIVHVVPLRDPKLSIVSSMLMRSYDDINMEFNEQYLVNEIFNFITFSKLENKYKNVVSVPIELFNNNEEKVLSLILKKYNIKTKTHDLNKDILIRSFKSFDEMGKTGLIKFHSYPIKEQNSDEYISKRLYFENFVNTHAKELIDKISEEYKTFLEVKKQDWGM